jgi:hypothetical protein
VSLVGVQVGTVDESLVGLSSRLVVLCEWLIVEGDATARG